MFKWTSLRYPSSAAEHTIPLQTLSLFFPTSKYIFVPSLKFYWGHMGQKKAFKCLLKHQNFTKKNCNQSKKPCLSSFNTINNKWHFASQRVYRFPLKRRKSDTHFLPNHLQYSGSMSMSVQRISLMFNLTIPALSICT